MKRHVRGNNAGYGLILNLFLGFLCLAGDVAPAPAASAINDLASLRQARQQAKHRQRRIIMNNDGNDFHMLGQENLDHPEQFLAVRTLPLIDSQVDSIFYGTGVFNMYSNPMDECEPRNSRFFKPELMAEMKKRDIDPLKMMIAFCRQHHKEIFWSMRMNDSHDSGAPENMSQWKRDNPDYLVGVKGRRYPYGANRWACLDYNHAEVREKAYRILEEICRRYDVDGVELDFFRSPVIFKEQMVGQPVTQAQCDLFTEMLRRIREMTEIQGLRRGKPLLIAIRIPDSLGYCKALGLDVERWLKEGLIDVITGGCYFKLEPWENLVALGKKYETPVYACLVRRRIEQAIHTEEDKPSDMPRWRGEAYLAWKAGVDGIYTFNRDNPHDPIFDELGDPALLETLERRDQTVFINPKMGIKPQTWLKDGQTYLKDK
ncbi:MAG: hypothetical protein JW709_08285 [Sedimentisphaerales bacterium]|nr:hypothetical protein [Sedimentisphaerales bacterium]